MLNEAYAGRIGYVVGMKMRANLTTWIPSWFRRVGQTLFNPWTSKVS